MRIVLDPAAKMELREAALFYENTHKTLGQEFLDTIESAFEQIAQHPELWRLLKGRFRRYLLPRFPYGVIYTVEGQTIFIAAIMHLKRKPGYWETRNPSKQDL